MIPRVSRLVCALAALPALLGSARAAPGFAVALDNELEHTKIMIADLPGQPDFLVVAWQDIPGVAPASGAMIYAADRGGGESRYTAVGGGGRFTLIERGRGRRGRGPLIGFDVVSDDPKRPLSVGGDAREPVDVAALVAQYGAFERIAAPGDSRAAIDAAIAAELARANQACSSRIAVKLAWQAFATPASQRLAKQAVAILEAIAAACGDKDYAKAVRELRELRVDYQAAGGALRFERTGAALAVRFSDTSFNPRETARVWLTEHL